MWGSLRQVDWSRPDGGAVRVSDKVGVLEIPDQVGVLWGFQIR